MKIVATLSHGSFWIDGRKVPEHLSEEDQAQILQGFCSISAWHIHLLKQHNVTHVVVAGKETDFPTFLDVVAKMDARQGS